MCAEEVGGETGEKKISRPLDSGLRRAEVVVALEAPGQVREPKPRAQDGV